MSWLLIPFVRINNSNTALLTSNIPLSVAKVLNIIGNFWVIDLFACHKLGGDKKFIWYANEPLEYKTPSKR